MKHLRLAAHIHTSCSDDSDWEIGRLARLLRASGFHGMLVCDHDRTMTTATWSQLQEECDTVGDSLGFLIVPGVEYQDTDHIVHLPVFGRIAFQGRSPEISATIRAAYEQGAVSVFAHPRRRDAFKRFDPTWAPYLGGIEVWSRKYDGIAPNPWASMTASAFDLPRFTSLDWHGPRQLYPLSMDVVDPGPGSNKARGDAVLESLRSGEFTPRAFNMDIRRFSSGPLYGMTHFAEDVRTSVAPALRKMESRIRRSR